MTIYRVAIAATIHVDVAAPFRDRAVMEAAEQWVEVKNGITSYAGLDDWDVTDVQRLEGDANDHKPSDA